ncbi:IclR family transcriptional regulator [Streptomyces sp. TRM72054]|uniref:IclR family transcriptional regulator n=1 Tax=Streptomyces sp. TRM72054 TaxID=2870562 RepID=UPI001C8C9838|nr:IclR family transcriptional regulator [Streptomyces sp. TRM72054]MBX9392965.1 IclR family transcriptional regulator [Streptomyces sp. TRM72054]
MQRSTAATERVHHPTAIDAALRSENRATTPCAPVDTDTSRTVSDHAGTNRRTPPSTLHVIQALESLASDPRGVTAKAIARRSGQSLSSVYYLLQALSSMGLAERSSISHGLYLIGPKIAELFHGYAASWRLPERLDPILVDLRDRAGARAYTATWNNADLEITAVRGRRGASELHNVSAGFTGAAHTLALGKVILAVTQPRSWPSYLQQPNYHAYTTRTITTPKALQEELAIVRRRGYATDIEEYADNVCCIAAPIRDSTGRVLSSIGLSVSARRFHRHQEQLKTALLEAAANASSLFHRLDPLGTFLTHAYTNSNEGGQSPAVPPCRRP